MNTKDKTYKISYVFEPEKSEIVPGEWVCRVELKNHKGHIKLENARFEDFEKAAKFWQKQR